MQIKYKITTLSPVLLTSDSGELNTVNTNEYIHGNSIIGIFASKYIRENEIQNAHEDQNFRNLFLSGDIKFSNAYIVTEYNEKEYQAYPIPFSIQKNKDEDNIIDLINNDNNKIQTKSISGFGYIDNEYIYTQEVKKIINFHHSIKEGQIFHYAAIKERQIFKGEILGDRENLELFLKTFGNQTEAYIGRSKSSQYGKVLIELEEIKENKKINQDDVDDEIVITLISDTIIFNENGYSTTNLKDFEKNLGYGISVEKSFIKTGQTENFVGVWKLRKPSENCFLAGSCFKVNFENNDSKINLIRLFESGIGERTNEGFGRFLINYQNEDELEIKEERKEINEPKNISSKLANNILKFIIQKNIKDKIKLLALQEMKEFHKYNPLTNSLLGKLRLIISEAKNIDDFQDKVKSLRKIARDKLDSCNNGKKTLYEFIETINFNTMVQNNAINQMSNFKKLIEQSGYDIFEEEEKKYINNLSKIYFDTFFSSMIKENNKKELANVKR